MTELKRRKRQLEHQLAEKQKQEQVVKVGFPIIERFDHCRIFRIFSTLLD